MGENSTNLDFEFEINLQRLCFIEIAKTLWGKEKMKRKVVRFFKESYNRYDEEEDNATRWNKLTRKVLIPLGDFSLPAKLNNKLKHVIRSLGWQIFNWTKYVTKVLKFDITCAREIFWTHYGTIDKIQIFKNWYNKRILEPPELFNMACIFCLEEYIPSLWNEIPDEIKEGDFYTETIYMMSKYTLIAYWKNTLSENQRDFISPMVTTERVRIERLRNQGDLENVEFILRRIAWLYIFANSISTEENMFRISVLEGLELGVRHFWNKLNEEQGKINVPTSMQFAKGKSEEPEYTEILIFLLSKLSVKENMNLGYDDIFLLKMLLKNWPWDEFFNSVLDSILECYENSIGMDRDIYNYETKLYGLVQVIADVMKTDFDLYGTVEGSEYRTIFHETWNKIPESVKILVAGTRDYLIFSKLLNLEDFKSLALIINHESFRGENFSKRRSLISCMKSLFVSFRSDRKLELIERFAEEIGLDRDERIKLGAEFRSLI